MIKLTNICKSFNNVKTYVLKDINIEIAEGEILVLLGSSGSGKTTLLKIINKLIPPSSGKIDINGKDIQKFNTECLRKTFGYVFQGVGLFPHMTVERNVAIILELIKKPIEERQSRAEELLELVGLNPKQFSKRYPNELSGGQQQRVGVARALAANPKYLLMDEPFGALDAITRDALQEEILHLNNKLHKTIVFVTHDISEAFKIADRIAVMHDGQIHQIGTKKDLLKQPKSIFVQQLINKYVKNIETF